jgi:hypothetical protein
MFNLANIVISNNYGTLKALDYHQQAGGDVICCLQAVPFLI